MSATTRAFRVPYPEVDELHLSIRAGLCHLEIRPGGGRDWVTGRYHDPTGELPLRLYRRGGRVQVRQPAEINLAELLAGLPSMTLELGRAEAFSLTIEEAGGECVLDLGGLPIRELTIQAHAGAIELDFSAPNPQLMRLLDLDSGGAAVRARNLCNANFGELYLGGHAAAYTLDFSGRLRHPAVVSVALSSRSALELGVPEGMAAAVLVREHTGRIDAGGTWTRTPDGFQTTACLADGKPLLTVNAGLNFGSLRLHGV